MAVHPCPLAKVANSLVELGSCARLAIANTRRFKEAFFVAAAVPVQTRVDAGIKERAGLVLDRMGLTTDTAAHDAEFGVGILSSGLTKAVASSF